VWSYSLEAALLKPARLIILQSLLFFLAMLLFAQSNTHPFEQALSGSDHALPAAGRLLAVSPMPVALQATPEPVIPTLQPASDFRAALVVEAPGLAEFAERTQGGDPELVTGLYAPGRFDLLVEQQPPNHNLYVSEKWGYATQFARPLRFDVIGLLAHNTFSGILFYELGLGDNVFLVFGDGRTAVYRVEAIEEFQKLEPGNARSDYIELSTGSQMTTNEVFARFYKDGHHLILQTCLARHGDASWGVRFIRAEERD
jgi:hypothetical protein